MAFPLVLILAGGFWGLITLFKCWYYSRFTIQYKHKLDEKLLQDLHQPPKHFSEKMRRMQLAREKNYDDEPALFYDKWKRAEREKEKMEHDANKDADQDDCERCDKEAGNCTAHSTKRQRPLTIFEEMDLRKKQRESRKNCSKKFDQNIFEDSLTRLYRDLQRERNARKKAEEVAKDKKEKEDLSVPLNLSSVD